MAAEVHYGLGQQPRAGAPDCLVEERKALLLTIILGQPASAVSDP